MRYFIISLVFMTGCSLLPSEKKVASYYSLQSPSYVRWANQ